MVHGARRCSPAGDRPSRAPNQSPHDENGGTRAAQVTKHVALLSRWVAADLYIRELDLLQFELSMARCTAEFWDYVTALRDRKHAADGGSARNGHGRSGR